MSITNRTYINHITLNTAHSRKSYANEVNKELYFALASKYKQMLNGSAEIMNGFTAKAIEDNTDRSVIITIYDPAGNAVLTSLVAKSSNTYWELMHETATTKLATTIFNPPQTPFVADRIELGATHNLEIFKWTGDFTKCMAWTVLYPDLIR